MTSDISSWDSYDTWNLVLPPSRPDVCELSRIRTLAIGLPKEAPVAILGSTPEFRETLVTMGFQAVYCFDRSPKFYARMTALLGRDWGRDRNAETLIVGNWLTELPKYRGGFSLILSDLTSGNVPYAKRSEFYSSIEDALAPGGFFVDKCLTNEGHWYSDDDIRAGFEGLPVNLLTVNRFSCIALFCSRQIRDLGRVDTDTLYAHLEAVHETAHMRCMIDHCRTVTPSGMQWYYGREWETLRSSYCPRLRRVERFALPHSSPYYGNAFQSVFVKDGG
jgi:SAM-dependent methyltransferase